MIKSGFVKYLLLPLLIFLMEIVFHLFIFGFTADKTILNYLLSSICLGCLLSCVVSLFRGKGQKIMMVIILLIFAVIFGAMMVYYNIFHTFFMWNTIGLAGDVTAFWREALAGIWESKFMILAILSPIAIYLILFRKADLRFKPKLFVMQLTCGLLAFAILFTTIIYDPENLKVIRKTQDDVNSTYLRYGALTGSTVDLYQTIFGVEESDPGNPYAGDNVSSLSVPDVQVTQDRVILKNALNIDFDRMIAATSNATIKKMHQYFASVTASDQNEYTGMFAGKNLIFLTLEGFSYRAVSKELTPTLYRMYNEGFQFTNFYDSMWGGSTASGEYSNITGNFYTTAACLPNSEGKMMYTAMGNVFLRAGYTNYSYHDGYDTYYSRNVAYPALGYKKFVAIGSGLKLQHNTWPQSDLDMAQVTYKDYINSKTPFHAYYMTISGHTNYTFKGNAMARKNKAMVDSLPYSDLVKGYIATQIEVDKMLEFLISELEKAGKLQDTVIALCCDHYPYGLPDTPLAELYGVKKKDVRANFDIYRNYFLCWCASMEHPIVIDEPCTSYDIVPTLANLFGLEYDSRFFTGTDILSSKENICIINTRTAEGGSWNWKTRQGTYYTVSKKFVPSETCTMSQEEIDAYVRLVNSKVENMKKYSPAVLDHDYYKYVFNKDGTPKYPLKQTSE
ncbi:MAG: sulfatase-like hydrolase/transferase [Erysipelotrichaceae bacterium]|nr:sulfatase-like hydrolase/transferase [Erysipelotrichaceae bacterium]